MGTPERHERHRVALEQAALRRGVLDPELRARAVDGTGPELVQRIRTDSAGVTAEEVARLRDDLGSDRAAFEVILAAGIGAGLKRWDAAMQVIRRRTDDDGATG